MNDKLKKLQELADIIDAREDNNEVFLLLAKIKDIETKLETLGNFATKQEAEDIYNALANAFNELKTGDKTGELESKINLITNDYKKLLKSADYSTDYFKKEIQTIKNVVADLKAVKAQVIDTEKIIKDTSKLVKDELIKLIPKEKELPQVPTLQEIISNIPTEPEKIRDALELLQGEERLDASAIKGLQELIKGLKQEKATIIGANKPLSGLLDVDVAGIAVNQSIKWDGIKWVAFTPSAGVTSFTGLTDTPSSYTGQGGKIVKVKGTEDGLEFDVATDTDEKVKLNVSDPTAGYLDDKITAYFYNDTFVTSDWSLSGSYYILDVVHSLDSTNLNVEIRKDGKILDVDSVENIDANTIRLSVPSNPNLRFDGSISIVKVM